MGHRMSAQKMLRLKQDDQGCQSGVRSKVLSPRCVLSKTSPPILLPLAAPSRKPTTKGDLLEETQKDGKPDHLKPPIIEMGPQRMNRSTVGATIPLERQGSFKLIKESAHITMTPQPWTPAPRTPRRARPRILLSHLRQELDIEIAIQYQVGSLRGITEGTSPRQGINLGYPFSFPSSYSEKKKDLYNKR